MSISSDDTKKTNSESTAESTLESIKLNSKNINVADPQQLQQRLWVREQEISALKVQNRHLISKIEEAENNNRPNQINTQQIANDVQIYLRPVLAEIERSLSTAFEMVQGTMRGIYQQSQRAQQAVEDMTAYSRDLETRIHDQRRAEQVNLQEKVFSTISVFCERIERQIENRLQSLSVIDQLNIKQTELLNDLDSIKNTLSSIKGDREVLQQVKILRDEIRNLRNVTQEKSENTTLDVSQDDLTLVLDLLRSQKRVAQNEAKNAEDFLIKSQQLTEEGPEINP